ncbi:response regulator receiver protein [Methanoregula boonei 6A8]|jgi:CheY-like chemotaxis protein|uniref:Response regulator receiver protein n=1 Tax=Methanoregula boonei (strain DSM 21154 / JCM 14090 / 6A8) TaxID=456442 RepID=A7I6Q7_METB6|nr:response regulator [Methanoregula boonei]ABS55418.1 response regulator receiver protein [Methanoregula boonei 6A8]
MSKGTILLVEDDDIIAKVVGWRLEKLGYSLCGRASSGTEALDLLERNVPDLILMDINIKGEINGIETTKMIKKRIHIPVIYLTSHSDDVTLARAKETYPEGFISKPFNDNDLKVAIELALNSSTLR